MSNESPSVRESEAIGEVLSGASTLGALCDLYAEHETEVSAGMFLVIKDSRRRGLKFLARVADVSPKHAFYRPGDAWSGARRARIQLPSEIGTQYVTCALEIVAEIDENGKLRPPTSAPFPGSEVIRPSSKELFSYFAPDEQEAVALFAGMKEYSNVPIPLLVNNIPMHIGVFGVTGSGKSFTVGVLIEAFSKFKYRANGEEVELSYPMLIIDPHGDYREYGQREGWDAGIRGKLYGLPGSDRRIFEHVHIDLSELDIDTLAEMIVSFYSGLEVPPPIQVWGAKLAIELTCRELHGLRRPDNRLFTNDSIYQDLQDVVHELSKASEKRSMEELSKVRARLHPQTVDAIVRAFDKFRGAVRADEPTKCLLGRGRWAERIDRLIRRGEVAVIELSPEGAPGVDITVKQLFVGYLAYVLFRQFYEYKMRAVREGEEDRFLLFILEEAQNYCPNMSLYAIGAPHFSKKYISTIATQGRKFGLSLLLITQRPAFVDTAVLSQFNTFFIHRIAPHDISYVCTVTGGLPKSIEARLSTLDRGEVVISGVMLPTFFPLVAKVEKEHRRVEHRAGKVNPAKSLLLIQRQEQN